MNLQKRLAAQILKCSPHRVIFNSNKLDEIKEAITKVDIKSLIKHGIITKRPVSNTSRFHARKIHAQKKKGRRKGFGSRKGKKTARARPKSIWMSTVRQQRNLIKKLRSKGIIPPKLYREIYMKSKGGFFRSRRHMNLYIKERILSK